MMLCSLPSTRDWLAAVTSRADTNPWRSEWRQAVLSQDVETLIAMSEDERLLNQPPRSVINLHYSLKANSPDLDATSAMQRVCPLHPGDFWLCFELGEATRFDPIRNWDEKIRYYSVAAGARPLVLFS